MAISVTIAWEGGEGVGGNSQGDVITITNGDDGRYPSFLFNQKHFSWCYQDKSPPERVLLRLLLFYSSTHCQFLTRNRFHSINGSQNISNCNEKALFLSCGALQLRSTADRMSFKIYSLSKGKNDYKNYV